MEKFNLRYFKTSAFIILVGIMVLSLYLLNIFVSNHWGVSFALFATVLSIIKFVDSKLWNIFPFKYLYSVPDFSGRYEGLLESEYRNGSNKKVRKSLEHIKVITQNGSNIVVSSWTKKEKGEISTKSTSMNAVIIQEEDGTYSLVYNYLNSGNYSPELNLHYGTEILKLIETKEGKFLMGRYFTERKPYQTKGKVNLEFVNKNLSHEKF